MSYLSLNYLPEVKEKEKEKELTITFGNQCNRLHQTESRGIPLSPSYGYANLIAWSYKEFYNFELPLEQQTCHIIDNILYHEYYNEKFSFRSSLLEQDYAYVLDVKMPDLNGFALYREIKKFNLRQDQSLVLLVLRVHQEIFFAFHLDVLVCRSLLACHHQFH